MKKAFTMIELVMVIIVAGILAAMAFPRMNEDNIYQAANQVASHIRYTQHLAMQDNKFNLNDNEWFRGRWQIQFVRNITSGTHCTEASPGAWAYHVYSDHPAYTGNPDIVDLARNPENRNKFLSGGFNNTICIDSSENPNGVSTTRSMRLGEAFGIEEIAFSTTCSANNSRRISFDNMGRPLFGAFHNYTRPYGTASRNRIVRLQCVISLCTTSTCNPCTVTATATNCPARNVNRVDIAIEPETGYTHIL